MAKRGATPSLLVFTQHEERLIVRIDQNSARRREFVIKSTEALKFTVCSIITRKRKQTGRKGLMN